MAEFQSEGRFHLLSIPYDGEIAETYFPSRLSNADYPRLLDVDKPVETLAVGSILAAFNWPDGSDRYQRVERFVEAFFSRFDEFLQPGRHPKWKEVNVAADTPGWERFKAADEWLKGRAAVTSVPDTQAQRFEAFMNANAVPRSSTEREALFQEFLAWDAKRQQRGEVRQRKRAQ